MTLWWSVFIANSTDCRTTWEYMPDNAMPQASILFGFTFHCQMFSKAVLAAITHCCHVPSSFQKCWNVSGILFSSKLYHWREWFHGCYFPLILFLMYMLVGKGRVWTDNNENWCHEYWAERDLTQCWLSTASMCKGMKHVVGQKKNTDFFLLCFLNTKLSCGLHGPLLPCLLGYNGNMKKYAGGDL